MTLSDLEGLSETFNDMKHRAVSQRYSRCLSDSWACSSGCVY